MTSDLDVMRTAAVLIKHHGEQAWTQAVDRYFALQEQGDEEGMAVMRRVVQAINRLKDAERIQPGPHRH